MIAKDTESEKSIITKIEETWYNELFSSKKNLGLRKVIYYYCRKLPYLQKEDPFSWSYDFNKDILNWFNKKTVITGPGITLTEPIIMDVIFDNEPIKFEIRDFEFRMPAWDKFALNENNFILQFKAMPPEGKLFKQFCDKLYSLGITMLFPVQIDFYFKTDIVKMYNIPKTYQEYLDFNKLIKV